MNLLDWSVYGEKKSREKSKPVTLENEYIGIYCHWDGYPDGIGKVLLDKFNNYDDILNLISGGWCSSVDYEGVRHYANRDKEYWDMIKPTQTHSACVVAGWTEYAYVFKNNKWYYAEVKWGDGDKEDTIGKLKVLK